MVMDKMSGVIYMNGHQANGDGIEFILLIQTVELGNTCIMEIYLIHRNL